MRILLVRSSCRYAATPIIAISCDGMLHSYAWNVVSGVNSVNSSGLLCHCCAWRLGTLHTNGLLPFDHKSSSSTIIRLSSGDCDF